MRALALSLLAGVVVFPLEATAAQARNAKLTAEEEKWVRPLVTLVNTMATGLNKLEKQARAKDALFVGTKSNRALSQTLATFYVCPSKVKKAGAPPTKRLGQFDRMLTSACASLRAGARDLARSIAEIRKGKGKSAAAHIAKSTSELEQGSKALVQAERTLLELGAGGIKS
jgi:hypothetical protein